MPGSTWSFFTFCQNPYLITTSPADGETGVLLDARIVVTFSEAMDTRTVDWVFSDPGIGLSDSWNEPVNDTLTLTHATPFAELRSYTIEITGDVRKVEACINLLQPLGIKELVRTGRIAIAREPVRQAAAQPKRLLASRMILSASSSYRKGLSGVVNTFIRSPFWYISFRFKIITS